MNGNLIITIIAFLLLLHFGIRTLNDYGLNYTPKLSFWFGEFVKKAGEERLMNSFILFHSGANPQIEILNRGTEDIYLHKSRFNNESTVDTKETFTVPAGFSYFINSDGLISWIKTNIGQNGERWVPYDIYLSDRNGEKYIMRNRFYIKVKEGVVEIRPQTLSLEKESW